MAYIGARPLIGNYQICDAITASATADYTLQVGSVNVVPESANAMIVSLNSVIQGPGASRGFTVSGSTISFNSALTSSDVIDFIYIFGDVLDIGTPTDGTVTAAKLAADAVTTAKILDANVTTAKILDANVTTAKILDDNVTTAKIADNNVTLAKLGDGTQGDVLYYGASGAPARLGFGTSGDFLKTQGTGANPVWATAGGGAWTKISTISGNDVITEADFTTLSTDYIDFKVIGTNVVCGTEGDFHFRYSVSSTFLTSGYGWAKSGIDEAGSAIHSGSTSAATIPLNSDACGNVGGENTNFELTIYDPHDTTNIKVAKFTIGYISNGGTLASLNGAGINDGNVAAVDGLRFYFASSTIKSGEITLYGRKIT